jgi:hypothetical protein
MANLKTLILTADGEHHLVDSLDGYPDAEVLERNVTPHEFGKVEGGKYVEDAGRKAQAKRRESAMNIDREELIARLESAEARLDALGKAEK